MQASTDTFLTLFIFKQQFVKRFHRNTSSDYR